MFNNTFSVLDQFSAKTYKKYQKNIYIKKKGEQREIKKVEVCQKQPSTYF